MTDVVMGFTEKESLGQNFKVVKCCLFYSHFSLSLWRAHRHFPRTPILFTQSPRGSPQSCETYQTWSSLDKSSVQPISVPFPLYSTI